MKRKVFLIALLLLLLGGGAAAWQFGQPTIKALLADSEPMLKKRLTVTLEPLVIPVIRGGQVIEHVTLGVQLQVLGIESENRLRDRLPNLRDAFVTELYALLALRYVQEHRQQLTLVKDRLRLVTDRVLGPGVVEAVLISGMDRRGDLQPRG